MTNLLSEALISVYLFLCSDNLFFSIDLFESHSGDHNIVSHMVIIFELHPVRDHDKIFVQKSFYSLDSHKNSVVVHQLHISFVAFPNIDIIDAKSLTKLGWQR